MTVCIVGEHTHASRWVALELRESLDKGNTIIAVSVPGHEHSARLPRLLEATRAPLMAWDLAVLQSLIAKAPPASPVP